MTTKYPEMAENPEKRLFLLDAYALIFRAYYAFIKNPRITSKGMNTSAIFGFLLALEELLKKHKPSHIAVVFDHPSPTFRHEMFSDYKATRSDTPEDIKRSIPWIKKMLEGFRIPVYDCPGFEADDVIGTLARKATEKGYTTYMMTPDKDFAQLVSDNVFIIKPSRGVVESVIWGVEDVKREFQVNTPEQVIDVLALMGDSSDNIPGAPGIGPKTAMKLISEFGSVETLLDNASKVKGKCGDILIQYRQQIEFSKSLVRIDQNAPIELVEDALKLKTPDPSRLMPLFDDLEFRSVVPRIFAEEEKPEKQLFSQPVGDAQGSLFDAPAEGSQAREMLTLEKFPHSYKVISTDDGIKAFAEQLAGLKEFCFSVLNGSPETLHPDLVALSFSWEPGTAYMVLFPEVRNEASTRLEYFRPVFEDEEIRKIGHNLKAGIQLLAVYGIEVKGGLFDTMIAHYLLEPDSRHELDILAELYLSYRVKKSELLAGEKGLQNNIRNIPAEQLLDLSAEDCDISLRLKKVFEPRVILEELDNLAGNIEMPLIKVLASMEQHGVKLDLDDLKSITVDLRDDILKLEWEIYELAGTEFNISSPKQLGDILFVRLKLDDKARMTKTKQFITNEEILQKLVSKHPIVEKVLEYRGLKKLLTTYVEALPLLVDHHTGRIHTYFNQAVAATGRLSSNNPNLQNIPVRDERGRQIRKAFVPEEGYSFLSVDYSQIELRLMAHLSRDESMISDFLSGNDIHAATAAKIFGVSMADVTREMRSRAKTANFGIIYGISTFGLSERLTIGRKEAKELIDGYFASYPGVKLYMEESIRAARELGYVKTMFGRRRYLRDIHSRNAVVRGMAERNAINAPIQGSAADIIKIAMVRIHERMKGSEFRSKMILQVHDELIFEVWEPEFDTVRDLVVREMSGAAKLDVPLAVDWGKGKNWFEAH